jgi:membrane protease YdiL (CAAX protease family)
VSRYSRRQIIIAKCAFAILVSLVASPFLADHTRELPVMLLVVLMLTGIFLGVYEAVSHGLALLLVRFTGRHPAPAPLPVDALNRSRPGVLHRRDAAIALLAYVGAQALVWTVAGLIAAAKTGTADQAGMLRALAKLLPVFLPASLIAGVIATLLVLRNWQKRLGAGALGGILGLSWGRRRHMLNGALAGAALALFVLPLMSLMADRPEPPNLVTQLTGSSRSALQAWMLSAVLLAPPIEELVFRGALLGSLTVTWNLRAAALVSGTAFWLMHGPEFVHWPAALAIGLLTVLATWLRVKHRSLGPPVAAHFGYNLVVAGFISLALMAKPEGTRWAQDHPIMRMAPTWGWTANPRW